MKNMKWSIGLLVVVACVVLSLERSEGQAGTRMIAGEQRAIGKGTVRTWLRVDAKTEEPLSLGVTLSDTALTGLPADSDPPQAGSTKHRLMDGGPNFTFEY